MSAKSVSVRGHVVATEDTWSELPPMIQKCSITEAITGIRIENLPCAGLGLRIGDVVEVTVKVIHKPVGLRGDINVDDVVRITDV